MWSTFRQRLAQLRGFVSRDESPRLADETRWYTEHTALLISTLKWALLGAVAGVCVGLGTRVFLWALARSADWARALTRGRVPVVRLSAAGASALRLDHPHVRRRRARPRHRGGHRRRAPALRPRRLARRAGQAGRDGRDAGVWRIGRQGRTGRADWRGPDQSLRRHPAPARRGPAPAGHLRHQRRLRGGVRHAGVRSAVRDRSALSRTDRLHA